MTNTSNPNPDPGDELPDGPPDIHDWPDHGWAADYASSVEAVGWKVVSLDCTVRWDKAGFLAACQRAFDFPGWFGHNWDGLVDSLRDVEIPSGAGLLVLWTGWGPMARTHLDDYLTAVDVLTEFVRERRDEGQTVLVARVGSGPSAH